MNKIHGTNLGNWLVLEKWMNPAIFEEAGVEDETWLARTLSAERLSEVMEAHRKAYLDESDLATIASMGLDYVRLPVPYSMFGDRPPQLGCVEYVDKVMDWAEANGVQVLLDLHTVPGSQNGYDNGGITGVCKWHKNPDEVEYALTVLERMAEHYGSRPGLFGIEVLNEPISWLVYVTAPSTGKAKDKSEAKGSGHVPLPFLRQFYTDAYRRLRKILPAEKAIVFHDGFRLGSWNRFFREAHMENVFLDTHIYIFAMENFVPVAKPWVYRTYIKSQVNAIRKAQRDVPVIVGEWCICNKYADGAGKPGTPEALDLMAERYREIAQMELDAWGEAAGWFYWNYQLLRDRTEPCDESWKESWDLCRCLRNNWLTKAMIG